MKMKHRIEVQIPEGKVASLAQMHRLTRGEIAQIDDPCSRRNHGRLVMRSIDMTAHIVTLDDGDLFVPECSFECRIFPPGTRISIVVGGGE